MAVENSSAAKGRLGLVDGARAIAILAVILVHSGGFVGWFLQEKSLKYLPILNDITSAGRYGVQLFFVISGFLISYLYEREPQAISWRREYLLRRFARIYPLWIVFLVINICLSFSPFRDLSSIYALTSHARDQGLAIGLIVLLGATFTLWLSPTLWNTVIGGGWSIQAEVVHYLAFLVLRNSNACKLLWLTVALQLSGFVLGVITMFSPGTIWAVAGSALLRLSVLNSLLYFVLGIFINRVWNQEKSSAFQSSAARQAIPGTLSIVLLLVLPGSIVDNFPKIGFIAAAVLLAYFAQGIGFINSALRSISRVSYSMYFVHFLVLGVLGMLLKGVSSLPRMSDGVLDVIFLSVTFFSVSAVTFLVSQVTYRLIESKANRWAHSKFRSQS